MKDLINNFRVTNQRQVILDCLQSSLTHPTAEQIFHAVRKKLPRISFGTVYRNLDILAKHGQIAVLNYCKSYARFDSVVGNHYHFICEHCDKVEDIIFDEIADIDNQVAKRHSVNVSYHRLFFYGLCGDCERFKISKK